MATQARSVALGDDKEPLAKALKDLAQKVAAVWERDQSFKSPQQESAHITT